MAFQGSTPVRTRLYRIAITQSLADVQDEFYVEGLSEEADGEPFRANRPCVAFSVRLLNPSQLPKLEP